MKAIVYDNYGSTDVLELREIEKPIPAADEVLVKVHAASVNSWDCDLVSGKPFLSRLAGSGVLKPKIPVLGCDIAGRVEEAGSDVKDFKQGDAVFGDISGCGWGGFAEYVCAKAKVLAFKPDEITFEQAAAIPQAGVLALQGLRQGDKLKQDSRILINGAGGGVGTFALQIAKMYGAKVTCVDRADKLDLLSSLGADKVIDYSSEDFTKLDNKYDLILNNVAGHKMKEYEKVLKPEGRMVLIGGKTSAIIAIALLGSIIPKEGKKMSLLMHKPDRGDLETLVDLIQNGKLNPVIHKFYKLSETPEAIEDLANGDVIGKAVVTLTEN